MLMRKFFRFFAVCVAVLAGSAVQAAQATYNTSTGNLTLDSVTLSNNVTYSNVVIHLTSLGQIAVNDPAVGSSITFNLDTFTLNLPSVTVGAQTYSKVSLKGPVFTLVSLNGISVDAGTSGRYNLDLTISASGIAMPAVRIENIDKPSTQTDFCTDDIYREFQQNADTYSSMGFSASWHVSSCSFNGTTGSISALLTVTSPYSMSLPYTVTYTYTAR